MPLYAADAPNRGLFRVLLLLSSALSVVLLVVSIALPNWYTLTINPEKHVHVHMGLWSFCTTADSTSICRNIPLQNQTGGLQSARAFTALAAVSLVVAIILSLKIEVSKTASLLGYPKYIFIIAGVCTLIGAGTFIPAVDTVSLLPTFHYSFSFFLCWVSGVVSIVAAVAAHMYHGSLLLNI